MVNEDQSQQADSLEAIKARSGQVDALQDQLANISSGVEKSLAVACETIMGKMKQLEDKIQDMEKRYTELAKDAEQSLKEADAMEPKAEGAEATTTPTAAEATTTTTTTTGEKEAPQQ